MERNNNTILDSKIKEINELLVQNSDINLDELLDKDLSGFSNNYLLRFTSQQIVEDILSLRSLTKSIPYAANFVILDSGQEHFIRLIMLGEHVSLSRSLPIIENFGVIVEEELPFEAKLTDNSIAYICQFKILLEPHVVDHLKRGSVKQNLEAALVEVFNNTFESDTLNSLVLSSGLNLDEVFLIRSITSYIVQTALPFSKLYIAKCLHKYPKIAYNLFQMFSYKFDLAKHNLSQVDEFKAAILNQLNNVEMNDEDRILRAFLGVIDAMVRTNYYQPSILEEQPIKDYISFKLNSTKLDFLPKPVPVFEIFVYSMRFEAIHLRTGLVARGGLRWSSRHEDFRTEVLGLVKAQKVKNSVIIPTGSKGGFICKLLPPSSQRDEYLAEGVTCYKTFIAGLLDITDNIVQGKVVAPNNVIRYDNDDPYLVVAADKGTATFSDYANEMSDKYNFWLGDAFASGGSNGYDHKKMGITAKGAWESAKRHFRHFGVNIQKQDFTVVGIGDMAGDVFGNGMLLSKHIKLIAAFNHQHIFLDPNPVVEASYLERQRLFNLPRSGWNDYDKSLISNGGGVYERSVKHITLSAEVKAWLGIDDDMVTPDQLIYLILQAPVDMLYNGGIGTYVKSSAETHLMVKDKLNDTLRVDANQLKAKVIVEGGNLGVTQLGRIEFAKNGGKIYTDAIDNSAGVDCSDHEVNIKILFSLIMQAGAMTLEQRNKLLVSMTNDIENLVLEDNYLQTATLNVAEYTSKEAFNANINYMKKLAKRGELDPVVEYMPSSEEILERQRLNVGLTLPELSVLLAYCKINLEEEILHSNLVDNPLLTPVVVSYFPKYLQDNYLDYIPKHFLAKEIIATRLANFIVNYMDISFVSRFKDEFSINIDTLVAAFWSSYQLLNAREIFDEINSLDNLIDADIQVELTHKFRNSLELLMHFILSKTQNNDMISQLINDYKSDVNALINNLSQLVDSTNYPEIIQLEQKLIESKVPSNLAIFIARADKLPQLLDIAMLANSFSRDTLIMANNYFNLDRSLRLDYLRQNLNSLPDHNKWQAMSISALIGESYKLYHSLISLAANSTAADDVNFIETWVNDSQNKDMINRINALFDEIQAYKSLDLGVLSGVVAEITRILTV